MSVTTHREGAVGVVTLDRPRANAFDEAQVDELGAALTTAESDPDVRAIVFRSAHRIFCGGADIAMMESWRSSPEPGKLLARFSSRLQDVLARIEASPTPSVAAISGAATGGGLELALACDFRVAGSDVLLGLPEVSIGLLPGAGGTQRLSRLAGRAVAHRLILGAELVDGAEAHRLGVVDHAVDGDVRAAAMLLAQRLAQLPPASYAAAKRCIAASGGDDGYRLEVAEIGALMHTPDTARLLEEFIGRSR